MKPNERSKAAAAEGAAAEEMRGTVLPFTPRRRPAYADSAAEAMLRFWPSSFWPWPGAWPQGTWPQGWPQESWPQATLPTGDDDDPGPTAA